VDSHGLRLAVHEWGELEASPLLLAHGGFDFARTFDVFAPLLADAGYRVVCWDQRGHGDSQHAELYSWDADVRDALAVLDSVSQDPVPLVGHSKGGSVLTNLVECLPHRARCLVNIDGLPSRRPQPDVADHERVRMVDENISGWLDHRRAVAGAERKPGSLDELARRRGRMNPRLSHDWLRYIASHGARHDPDGWRWKIDPGLRFGGFGPWRPDWALAQLPSVSVPLLGVLAGIQEPMGWSTTLDVVEPFLPDGARIETAQDSGHFIHIEQPRETADLVLEFLA
jgi:pimeloyl-ACP methyl ester carboxylesterase